MSAEDVHGCFPEFNPAKSLPPMPFQDLLTLVKSDRGEGYMVQDVDTDEYLVKLKSPYYLTLKLLSRGNPEFMFNNPPEFKRKMLKEGSEELSFLVDEITSSFTLDDWKGMNSDYKMYFIQGLV